MVVKMMVIDSESTTKIEQNQEPKIGAAVKAQLEQTRCTCVNLSITLRTIHCFLPQKGFQKALLANFFLLLKQVTIDITSFKCTVCKHFI